MNRHDWADRALCRTRPADWWDTADGGNRLAMTLCKLACPVLSDCGLYAHDEVGVIRAGIAYGNQGQVLPTCPCGRPVTEVSARPGWCHICQPAEARWRVVVPRQPQRRGRRVLHPCGTWQAWQRHIRHREPACDPCKAARRAHRVETGERGPQRRGRRRVVDEVAVRRVIAGNAHPKTLTRAERDAAIDTMAAAGMARTAIADRLHVNNKTVHKRLDPPARTAAPHANPDQLAA